MATPPMLDADHRNAPVLDDAALADLARQFRGELIRAGDRRTRPPAESGTVPSTATPRSSRAAPASPTSGPPCGSPASGSS